MKTSVNFSQFCDAFSNMGREDQFSYDAKRVLFDYLEQYGEDTGEEVELDVIAICCEYSEETWEEIADNFSIDTSDCEDEDEGKQAVEEYLLDNTSVVGVLASNSIVYAQF